MGAPVTIHDLIGNEDFQKATLQQKNAALMQVPQFAQASPLDREKILEVAQYGQVQPGTPGYETPGLLHPSAPGEPAVAPGESTEHAAARGLIGGTAQLVNPMNLVGAVKHPLTTIESIAESPVTIVREAEQGNLAAIPQAAALTLGAEGAARGVRGAAPAATEYALKHPEVVVGAGKTAGLVGGGVAGETFGGGTHGIMPGIGAYEGYRLGGDLAGKFVKSAEDRAINDVINEDRPLDSLPERLLPELSRRLQAQEKAYADLMARTGQTPEELNVPKSLRTNLSRYFEERAREKASLPRVISTPEEMAATAQRGRLMGALQKELSPEAKARGMAYAAGQHETEWVPSKRSVIRGVEKTYRTFPKVE